jgi:hypothetical protein
MSALTTIKMPLWVLCFALIFISCDNQANKKDGFLLSNATVYQKENVIFSLSLISNINEGRFGSVDSLQAQATRGINNVLDNDTVIGLIGTWKPVWGPVTYTMDSTSNKDSSVSDNTMVLLKGKDPDDTSKTMYVIAIAGTIGASSYDWFSEDFNLSSMAQWPSAIKNSNNVSYFSSPNRSSSSSTTNSGNYISVGVSNGLNILFNLMKDNSKISLIQYLQANIGNSFSSVEIAVAGHSLGGALAPCVALSLIDNQSYWNPSLANTITCYATAGFSPGNQNFATYFSKTIGSNFLGACNKNDVAINVYQSSTMALIPNLYHSILGNNCSGYLQNQYFIDSFMSCFSGKISQLNYTSLYQANDSFSSSIPYTCNNITKDYSAAYAGYQYPLNASDSNIINVFNNAASSLGLTPSDSLFARTVCFGAMTIQEHFNAYIQHFGIDSLCTIYSRQLSVPVPTPSNISRTMELQAFLNPIIKGCLNLKL